MAMDRHTAYRRGLCIDCQQVKPAAGMPRCWPCHSEFTGIALPSDQRQPALIRSMAGTHPKPAVYALALVTAIHLEPPAQIVVR